jgi:hypothetical protein
MRRLLVLALVGCGTDAPAEPSAQLVLDIPNGMLDPMGYTTVEITMHDAGGDTVRSAAIGADGGFDLGDLDPRTAISLEAVLRNDSGVAVGYGRTASAIDLAAGAAITVQVRRPIVYIAGVNYTIPSGTPVWFGLPATFSDLSAGTALDGTTTAADKPVLMISAGPQLFSVDMAVNSSSGALTGPATIRAVSTADHSMSPELGSLAVGVVQDGAGSDDGATLVVGTTERLYAVDTRPDAAAPVRELATGDFARVAMVAGADGGFAAVAIRNRVSTTDACNPAAELWWIADTGGEVVDARMVATGGFADVAADRGRAWYVDACNGELGEVLPTGVHGMRTDLGKPTALAVSNGQAWIGVELATPTALSIVVAPVEAAGGTPRTLWTEPQEQVMGATQFPGVERRLAAQAATFLQLEVGAGGDYVAAATSGQFFGARVDASNFPQMNIETRELRVFDAATGGVVQRYRSWCDGSYTTLYSSDIRNWRCANATGQTGPASVSREHRLSSMTFLFGKK